MLTFGGGALGWSLVTVVLAAIHSETRGSARPLLQLQTIGLHGFAAGSCWCIGNLFNTLAVVAGGNAVVVPISHAASLVTSGAWGLFYYKEIHGQAAIGWGAAAAWTVVMVVLLALEKA
uniref:Transmembrane protein 144 n=1 Tax=Chrysotila carterae TaxID=13221 RepID=A0A7S4AZ76_CHRCT